MHQLEILSLVTIVFIILKFIIFALNPKKDKELSKRLYSRTGMIKFFALILAFMVLYVMVKSGLTIIDILSVTLFLSLIMVIGIADYINVFVKKIKTKDLIKKELLYILIWIFLIGWGIKAIFF
jgi:predicted neutral ceramidase superfamily lipid hydrolase